MENNPKTNFLELTESITKASQKILQNYLNNSTEDAKNNQEVTQMYSELGINLISNPDEMKKIQDLYQNYFQSQQELWKRISERKFNKPEEYQPVISPDKNDKRFRSPEWDEAPYYFDFIKQNYLLISKLMKEVVDTSKINGKAKKKLNFVTQQYIDALSPTNFIATNPEAIKLAQETNGQSLIDGFNNLLTDIKKGSITQTDMSAFKIGKNIAITPGAVIFENELIQLIQYTPTTEKVFETPMLIIPPCINKYYILDLQPENSLVKFLVSQCITTYIISWKNPTSKMGHVTFDDYVEKACIKAIEVVQAVSKSKKINTLGYCLGGTMLGATLAILASKTTPQKNAVNSATFLGAMIDFSDVGTIGDIIDDELVTKLEKEVSELGMMSGKEMAKAFNMLRANDLIWNYVSTNYLTGKAPTAFDLLYWTNDNTNLTAKMYLYYLREMVLENKLSRKNALRICNTQIDIGKIDIPAYVIGLAEDHISPAKTTFTTTELVSGPVEFILGGSGHVMGAVNPPSKKKYGHYVDGKLTEGFEAWKESATFVEGSWWTTWVEKITNKSGKQIVPNKVLGNAKFKVIEPAPGRYVKEQCETCHPDRK